MKMTCTAPYVGLLGLPLDYHRWPGRGVSGCVIDNKMLELSIL